MLSQAPKLIRQLSTDPRLDAEIKTEAQQVLKIALYLKYDFNKLSRSNNRINRKDQHVFKFTPPFSYLKYIFIWNSAKLFEFNLWVGCHTNPGDLMSLKPRD